MIVIMMTMMVEKFARCYGTVNVALRRRAIQSSTDKTSVASRAVDNDPTTASCTSSDSSSEPWWSVDLGEPMDVGRVCVVNDDDKFGRFCQTFLFFVSACV